LPALLAKGKTADLLFCEQLEPIAPELLFTELKKHKNELLEKTKLSEEDFSELLVLFKKKIKIVPANEFKDFLFEANELLKSHTKDTEYVALALKFKCPLWSKEKSLKKLSRIKVLDADEVVNLLCL
jgi:predicted nucleic acid-binding protein